MKKIKLAITHTLEKDLEFEKLANKMVNKMMLDTPEGEKTRKIIREIIIKNNKRNKK
jgi:hypothetical protein